MEFTERFCRADFYPFDALHVVGYTISFGKGPIAFVAELDQPEELCFHCFPTAFDGLVFCIVT